MYKFKKIYKINTFLSVGLNSWGDIMVLVNGKPFHQCMFLLMKLDPEKQKPGHEIQSIDEAVAYYGSASETGEIMIPKEEEFWGHCSNLQAWVENDYNTSMLHSNLSFPLLKELALAGDPTAKRVLSFEISNKLISGFPNTIITITSTFERGMLEHVINELFTRDDLNILLSNLSGYFNEHAFGPALYNLSSLLDVETIEPWVSNTSTEIRLIVAIMLYFKYQALEKRLKDDLSKRASEKQPRTSNSPDEIHRSERHDFLFDKICNLLDNCLMDADPRLRLVATLVFNKNKDYRNLLRFDPCAIIRQHILDDENYTIFRYGFNRTRMVLRESVLDDIQIKFKSSNQQYLSDVFRKMPFIIEREKLSSIQRDFQYCNACPHKVGCEMKTFLCSDLYELMRPNIYKRKVLTSRQVLLTDPPMSRETIEQYTSSSDWFTRFLLSTRYQVFPVDILKKLATDDDYRVRIGVVHRHLYNIYVGVSLYTRRVYINPFDLVPPVASFFGPRDNIESIDLQPNAIMEDINSTRINFENVDDVLVPYLEEIYFPDEHNKNLDGLGTYTGYNISGLINCDDSGNPQAVADHSSKQSYLKRGLEFLPLEIIGILAKDNSPAVRVELAKFSRYLPEHIVLQLASDKNMNVRLTLVRSLLVFPEKLKVILLNDPAPVVRKMVITRIPAIPEEIFIKLLNDPSPIVRQTVVKCLDLLMLRMFTDFLFSVSDLRKHAGILFKIINACSEFCAHNQILVAEQILRLEKHIFRLPRSTVLKLVELMCTVLSSENHETIVTNARFLPRTFALKLAKHGDLKIRLALANRIDPLDRGSILQLAIDDDFNVQTALINHVIEVCKSKTIQREAMIKLAFSNYPDVREKVAKNWKGMPRWLVEEYSKDPCIKVRVAIAKYVYTSPKTFASRLLADKSARVRGAAVKHFFPSKENQELLIKMAKDPAPSVRLAVAKYRYQLPDEVIEILRNDRNVRVRKAIQKRFRHADINHS
ncbi:MAG: HEAT repeat domain-containing protein [Promethearchaeota archaeon]